MKTPRCPVCGSARVTHDHRPAVNMRHAGAFEFTDRSYDRCLTCGHTWNHKAKRRGDPAAPVPGFWTRLFQRFFPLTK